MTPLPSPAANSRTRYIHTSVPRVLRNSFVFACSCLCAIPAWTQQAASGPDQSVLERRYKAAQTYQAAQDLDNAAQQYRIFISDALGRIAIGHAHAGDYDKALSEFDEALSLVPNFPALQIEYARVALDSGNPEHAKLLAQAVLKASALDPKIAAKAHALLGGAMMKSDENAEAKHEIELAVSLDPTFENGYELAIADLNLGAGDAASTIFTEMLASFGDTAEIHMLFGQAYGGSDFQAKAVDEFKAAIAKDDHLPGAHYSLASAYLATGGNSRLAEVESELRKEIVISPENASAYAALGHLLANRHDAANDAEALNDLKRATVLDPKSPDAFLYLGQFYSDAKMPEEAQASLRKCIALTRDVSRNAYQVQKAHYLLGRFLVQSGKVDEGKQEIATSQTLMRQNLSRDQDRLASYLEDGKASVAEGMGPRAVAASNPAADQEAARATEAFEKQLGPAVADSYNNLGAIAGSKDNYAQALQYFKRAAEWNPSLPGLDYNWGRAAFAAGEPSEAIGPLSRYLQVNPKDDGARTVLGLSQFLSKDYAGTRKTLAPVADQPAETSKVRFAYAKSLIETSDVEAGIARLLDLEKSEPQVADVHRALGEALEQQNAPHAADELATAIRLNPNDAEAYAALGSLQVKQGKTKDALLNLETAVNLAPGNTSYREELAETRLKVSHE